MVMMPSVYVSDMEKAIEFYEKLGFPLQRRGRSASWAELEAGDAILALHLAPESRSGETGRVELFIRLKHQLKTAETGREGRSRYGRVRSTGPLT